MKPFKFLDGKINERDVTSWDFYQNFDGPIGNYRLEIEWYSNFIEFLSRFDPDYHSPVLVDEIRIPFDENGTYQDINHHNFDMWDQEFITHEGRVRVTWLNFEIL